jgi:hypothetical protein
MSFASRKRRHVVNPRLGSRISLAVALLIVAGACGGEDDSVTAPPTSTTATDTFSNILTLNGARVHTFTVTAGGSITALLTNLRVPVDESLPAGTPVPVGLSLGTWNGSICQIVLDNPSSLQGSVVVGQTTATGTFCTRIYDATGSVVEPQSYTIEVSYQVGT